MPNLQDKINDILIQWDPLQIKEMNGPVEFEYLDYISLIQEKLENLEQLENLLESILVNEMGLSYDSLNAFHKEELVDISLKLNKLTKTNLYKDPTEVQD
jgi:hypothetical protein